MRAAGFLGWVGIMGAVVASVMACSGDTFTNDGPGGGGDGGPNVDAGGGVDAGSDARQSCAPGVSEKAFCSNFDRSLDVRDDKWTVGGDGQHVQVRNASTSFSATTAPNLLSVDGDTDRAYVTTNLPATKRFKLTFDLRAQERGNQSFMPLRLSFCSRTSNCFTLQLRFSAEGDGRQVYLGDANGGEAAVGDTRTIDGTWTRVGLESNLEATAQGFATVRVTFGQPASAIVRVPGEVMAQLDHVELSLGAVSADTGGGGFNAYQLAFDTVVFDPAP